MTPNKLIKRTRKFATRYRITDGKSFRLSDVDPGDTGGLGSEDKPRAKELLQVGVELLADLQDKLYAQNSWAVLVIMQAMDAAGKDSATKHVKSGATGDAPWHVVPADNKWFTRLVVASAVIETLLSLDLKYPRVTEQQRKELLAVKRVLERGG